MHSIMENLLPGDIPCITFYSGSSPEKNAVATMPACISQPGSLGRLWLDSRLQGRAGSALHPRVQTQVAAVPAVQGHVVLTVGSGAQEGQTERLCWGLSHVASSGFSGKGQFHRKSQSVEVGDALCISSSKNGETRETHLHSAVGGK